MSNGREGQREFQEQGPSAPLATPSSEGRARVEGEAGSVSRRVEGVVQMPEILKGRVTPIASIDLDAPIEEKSLGNGHMLMVIPMNGGYHVCRVTNEAYKAYRDHFQTISRTRDIKLGQSAKEVLKEVVSIKTFGSGEYEKAKEFFDQVLDEVKEA